MLLRHKHEYVSTVIFWACKFLRRAHRAFPWEHSDEGLWVHGSPLPMPFPVLVILFEEYPVLEEPCPKSEALQR